MKEIEVSAAIIINNDMIFITKRGYGEYKGFWEFPGGKLEKGESKEDCLKREIKEELDVEIIIEKYLTTIEYAYPKFNLIMHCFICHFKSANLVLKEHDEAKYISLNDFCKINFTPADKLLYNDLKKYLKK